MPLRLYNSLTRQVEPFAPLDPACPTLYVCGPTVYNYVHIGNARGPVVFGVLAALLRRRYGRLKYARNITDVDDKINAAAAEQGVPISAITDRFAAAYRQDMAALGVAPPDIEPEATAHIGQIVAMIERLVASGHAYAAQGHVLFAVASFADYGKLSRRDTDEMLAGARVEVAPYKRDPGDFVLWKPSTPELPGWDSPWGRGRPGWHIECSAMAGAHLGRTIDIHAGGIDLQFPHHENEIAQSECAHGGAPFARFGASDAGCSATPPHGSACSDRAMRLPLRFPNCSSWGSTVRTRGPRRRGSWPGRSGAVRLEGCSSSIRILARSRR